MKIAIGADKYGYQLKEFVKSYAKQNGMEVEDYGVENAEAEAPYYEVASAVAKKVSSGEVSRGILVCGTGMGMAIIANKQQGIYAAVCENALAAERSRSINNSNILTLGGFVTQPEAAKEILDAWFRTEFTEGWDKPVADWLKNSMNDIRNIERVRFKKEEQ